MDAVHPVLSYGWIKRGEEHAVPSNSGRQRVNINGAIDLERLEPIVRFDDSINADSTIALFEQLEQFYAVATYIYVICDNARYYHARAVQAYLENSRIKLVPLPPYARMALSLAKWSCGSVTYGRDLLMNSNHLSATSSGGRSGESPRARAGAVG
jgi:hypothetical protein